MQWWFEKFCKGDESLEDEALSVWPLEVDSDQLRAIAEAYSLTATREVAEELNINYSVVIWHLKKIGKVKKLVKWVLHELTENLKKSLFWSVISFYSTQQQRTISWSDCDMQQKVDCIQQLVQWLDREGVPRRITSQSQTCNKKRSWSLLVLCCWTDILQLSESWQNHYIWEVCSADFWDALKTAAPAAGIGQQNRPNSPQYLAARCTINPSKVEWIRLRSFASSTIFTWPFTNYLPLLQASQQLFAGKALPHQ